MHSDISTGGLGNAPGPSILYYNSKVDRTLPLGLMICVGCGITSYCSCGKDLGEGIDAIFVFGEV